MNNSYKHLFSGFLLVMLDINIGSFDILPDVVGYLLVWSGLGELRSNTKIPSFRVARGLSIVLAIGAAFEIVKGTFGLVHLSAFISYAVTIFGGLSGLLLVVCIYHGMTTHMMILEEISLSNRFGNENKRFAVIQGLSLIAMSFSLNMPKDGSGTYMVALLAVSIIMHARLLVNLNYVKKLLIIDETKGS
ncbi:hypothetical protein [Anaerotalea alkaliphila]|uniref:Uncharacterized protein n=1 Tax=Anaerotalea alkaliphila TaxID=2662126 RepID=A0A7X5HVQ0_9FIRM|nr:hypothetical protein [Anaerotalea alkaliphila]NDL67536.1 hypothetical protein [Anaerotalea alkaliphila]